MIIILYTFEQCNEKFLLTARSEKNTIVDRVKNLFLHRQGGGRFFPRTALLRLPVGAWQEEREAGVKENIYDNEVFFEKYSGFPRSREGLAAAGEWHELKKLLPDFKNTRVLDLGCGFGWHCVYAAERGAKYVLGTDISEKMLAEARRRTQSPAVEYVRVAMEDFDYGKNRFDMVLSSLAFHYIEDLGGVFKKVYGCLAVGGSFVFSAEHPVFTAEGSQQWMENDRGEKLCWPVDRYFEEGKREAVFLGEKVTKYHRTVASYAGALLDAGFVIEKIVEPMPAGEFLERGEMCDELRRPMMIIFKAGKKR